MIIALRCIYEIHFEVKSYKSSNILYTIIIMIIWLFDNCYILTFWPGLKCHSKMMHRKEVTHSNGSYERISRGRKLADEIGRAKKFPWYTHRLMHRKRVTSELHDSYIRLMTIKHSISAIEWVLNYHITQSRRKSSASWVRVPASWSEDVVRKATPGRRGLGPWWVGVQRRCW